MVMWIGLAVLTALTAAAVLWPLFRGGASGAVPAASNDAEVYRDQLAEIGRDRDAGLIGAPEAEAARAEVARRLLKASREDAAAAGGLRPSSLRLVALIIACALPAAALAGYFTLGRPDEPDQPLAARAERPLDSLGPDELIARAEAKLIANPDDGEGWDRMSRAYYTLRRFDDAANATRNAIRLLGDTAERRLLLGQALFFAAEGIVTADAHAAFTQALKLAPDNLLARMYLILATEQDGRKDEALAAWKALLAEAKGGEPWVEVVRNQIARLEGRPPEPPALDDQQKAMIEGMVSGLANRLATQGGSADDWSRLMRSYRVLGRLDDARAARDRARDAMKDDVAGLKAVDDAAKNLGL